MTRTGWMAGAAGLWLALATNAQAQPAGRDQRVYDAAVAARPGELELLQHLVDIDSGTGDAAGAARIDALLGTRLQALGATLQTVPSEAAGIGDSLVATFTGSGHGHILIIAHVDTVFPTPAAETRPFRTDAERAYGPGVSDEKGGVVEAVTALKLLHDLGFHDYSAITVLLEASEEMGSPGARKLIDRLVRANDVELNMEPGDAPDMITVWRKGSETIRITVHGRAAHAGVDPQDGRNAAVELIHQLGVVDRFPHSGEGITVNLTTLKAGDRANVIPDLASAQVNIRVRRPDQYAAIDQAFQAQAHTPLVPDTTVEAQVETAFPPLPSNPATEALAAHARAIYSGLGLTLAEGGNGGASESALAAGTPALDGLGPVGGGFHSDKEFLVLSTVTPRLYLMTELLMQLGAHPPRPAP